MASILLVEDDRSIVETLGAFLRGEGFTVTAAESLGRALELAEAERWDLALLDVSLPDGSGLDVCRRLRQRGDTPVIFLTASDDETSVVLGFEAGADDYVSKPFRPRELASRIRSVLRRSGREDVLVCGSLTVDTARGTVTKDNQELALSALEYRLLLVFLHNRGKVLGRGRLLEEIWDIGGDFVNDNTLTVYIKRLRDKIEADPQNPQLLKTVRGLGYRMEDGT